MALELKIGLDVISSYKRLAYTPWHAIAEFVDNSTQNYFDHKDVLDSIFAKEGERLHISIIYDHNEELLRVSDNAMGMSLEELQDALHVAKPPKNQSGRSKYGMGLKTAACWIGDLWTIRTKKRDETKEYKVTLDVKKIAAGSSELPVVAKNKPKDTHYTIIEITQHNRSFHGRTIGKIRDFLRSMYREDFRNKTLILEWQAETLIWDEYDDRILVAIDGSKYHKEFSFQVDGNQVNGWVGILNRGSRADAGFSIIHCGRVIKGWPESWRPQSLYGQLQGTNDLVNQRLVGEIHLDQFDVSHTKDDILWLGDQEEDVEKQLLVHCGDYRDIALKHRKGGDDERGPSQIEIDAAVDELNRELSSPEMVDRVTIELVPPETVVTESVRKITQEVIKTRQETFKVKVGAVNVVLYIAGDMSPNDPYVVVDATKNTSVIVVVNTSHPHWIQLKGSEGVLNYLRDCTYDAVAEWQARSKASRVDPDTIKLLKDKLLRVPFEMEEHETVE